MTVTPPPEHLSRLVGSWTTEATHPAFPGVIVRGTATFEWWDGERFLINRARNEHPDFPNSISIIGVTNEDRVDPSNDEPTPDDGLPMTMHYFDSRGVFRVYEVSVGDETWRIWRDAPGFSQRFLGTSANGGDTVAGIWQMCTDDVNWVDDLQITYRRDGRRS
jgi:hypothetical protein